jgi:2,4-dienoyl-CoA reductase-like NADH-dependent reductase (Old Yellow Enzyme family)
VVTAGKVFHGPLMGICGYTQETAEQAIAEGQADLIAFGRPFISNPDLVERFRNGWPLADPAPMSDWYYASLFVPGYCRRGTNCFATVPRRDPHLRAWGGKKRPR